MQTTQLGEFRLACGECSTTAEMPVFETEQGQRFTTCSGCNRTVRVYGVDV
jgi:formate dehydrogenase maturation protein FdhE